MGQQTLGLEYEAWGSCVICPDSQYITVNKLVYGRHCYVYHSKLSYSLFTPSDLDFKQMSGEKGYWTAKHVTRIVYGTT